jgi:hypothetical protein
MNSSIIFHRHEYPYGTSWERWSAAWSKWMFSIPKNKNPGLDKTGKFSSENQTNTKVWFLAGTFGNQELVRRKVEIPVGRSILFPILVKEDSFEEDNDLKTELELINRSKRATDKVLELDASIDGNKVKNLKKFRVRSEVYNLTFPPNNIYDLSPRRTKSVCDGFWVFVRPLGVGQHVIYFRGETRVVETKRALMEKKVYAPSWPYIDKNSKFRVEVLYNLTITDFPGSQSS